MSSDERQPLSTFEDARHAVAGGTSPERAAHLLVAAMTPQERLWCLDGDAPTWEGLRFLGEGGYHHAPFHAARVGRVGLPGVSFSDGPRGVVIGNATCFPVSMARGATWDPALEERIGEAVGRELRASGATLTGAVCVNLLRHPAWGRAQETYGEDPHHVGEMGAALTRGLQRHVMACVKHFACNSMENARFKVDVAVDEVALHEVYLPHFRRIVDVGVASVMTAYNAVNGEWCGENTYLITDVLRGEWGFAGFVISDWIFGLRDAVKSVAAGLDVEMPYRMIRAPRLPGAIEAGELVWRDVDDAATRLVATLLRFDSVLSQPAPAREVIACTAHRDLARLVAARSVVLLRNEPIGGVAVLPLTGAAVARVAIVGRLGDAINLGDGGSSDVWALECVTVLDGLRAALPDVDIGHDDGHDIARAATMAASASVAIVVVGYTFVDEGEYIGDTDPALGSLLPLADEPEVAEMYRQELAALPAVITPHHIVERNASLGFARGGDRTSLRLPPADVALVRAVAAANPRTVVVIQSGSAVIVDEWHDQVAAIVQAWYGGGQAGHGLADVLLGRVNPSGRLPFTVPADESHLPPFDREADTTTYDRWHGWWRLRRDGQAPVFPFGFGLSYTTFELEDVGAELAEAAIRITGSVANTGERDGTDVVQVYVELPDPAAPMRLVGFTRVEVAAGARAAFTIDAPLATLATRDPQRHVWIEPSGTYRLHVGRDACDPLAHRLAIEV